MLVEAAVGVVRCSHNPSVVGSSPTRPTLITPLTCVFMVDSDHTRARYERRDMNRSTGQDEIWSLVMRGRTARV
jgi:hypothetical protein